MTATSNAPHDDALFPDTSRLSESERDAHGALCEKRERGHAFTPDEATTFDELDA